MRKAWFCLLLALALATAPLPVAAAEVQPPAHPAPMQEQFANLTQAQKDEIYELAGQVSAASQALVRKYAELGLIGTQTAEKLCEGMQQHLESARSSGKPIGLLPVRPAPKGQAN